MRKISVERRVERKRSGIGVQGVVAAGVVVDRRVSEPGDELVGIAHPLGRSERVACAVAVVLVKGLEVVVVDPLFVREQGTERGKLGVDRVRGDGVKGTHIHQVGHLFTRQSDPGQVLLKALANRGHKGGGEVGFNVVGQFAVLEGGAGAGVEGVVGGAGLGDDHVDLGRRLTRLGARILDLGALETLNELPSRGNHAARVRGSDERDNVLGERLVSLVELDARVDQLLLPKGSQIVGTQAVVVRLEERVLPLEGGRILLDLLDQGSVLLTLGRGRIPGSVAGENLRKGDPTSSRDLRGDG